MEKDKTLNVFPTMDTGTRAALYELLAIVAEQTGRKIPDRDAAAEEIMLRAILELDEEQKDALDAFAYRIADNIKAEREQERRDDMDRRAAIHARLDAELKAEERGCISITHYKARHHKKLL